MERRRTERRRRLRTGGPLRTASPTQIIAASFLSLIAVGAVLLALPISHTGAATIGPVEALFTATSAVCVTGLVVVDTGSAFSGFGQFVIASLFQLGGLGLLTFGTFLALITGRQLGLSERLRAQEEMGSTSFAGVADLARAIAVVVVGAETAGALLLYSRFAATEGLATGAWHAIFHSISAFNNAGFSLYSDSLMGYVEDPIVNLTIVALITAGGLGFVVISNLNARLRRRRPGTLTLHTKMVLATTGFLVAAAMTAFLLVEWNNDETFGPLSLPGRLLAALFAAVTPRTAGFNTVDYGAMTTAGLLLTMSLMFIGGNPGSTAGGIKTVTFFVVVLSVWSVVRGRADTVVFGRRLATTTVVRATAIAAGAVLVGGAAITLLAAFEPDLTTEALLFETVSALGTVGLSVGVTPELGTPARLILIVLMYLGRIGLLTFAVALLRSAHQAAVRRPAEEVIVG